MVGHQKYHLLNPDQVADEDKIELEQACPCGQVLEGPFSIQALVVLAHSHPRPSLFVGSISFSKLVSARTYTPEWASRQQGVTVRVVGVTDGY